MIAEVKPGQSVQLDVWRDKATKHITVAVEELKEKTSEARLHQHSDNGSDEGGVGDHQSHSACRCAA